MSGLVALLVGLAVVKMVSTVLSNQATPPPPVAAPRQVIRDELILKRPDHHWLYVVSVAVVIAVVIAFAALGPVGGGLVLSLTLPYFAPWFFVRHVTIPRGLCRASYVLGWLSAPGHGPDRRTHAVIGALLACARSGPPPPWLRARVEGLACSGGAPLAEGLVAELDGELCRAEAAVRICRCFDERYVTTTVQRLAGDWLATRLLERGDWEGVLNMGQRDQTHLQTLIRRCAGVIARNEPVRPVQLWLLWALGPRRRFTRALVQRAIRAPTVVRRNRTAAAPPDPFGKLDLPPHERVLSRLVSLASRKPAARTRAEMAALADEATALVGSPAFLDWIEGRRRALRSEAPLADLVQAVDDAVRDAVEELAVGSPGARAVAQAPQAVEPKFNALSVLLDDVSARCKTDSRWSEAEEQRAWLAVATLYEEIVQQGTEDDHAEAFAIVWPVICDFAVWLWNDRKLYNLANAVHRWLLHEADAVGHEQASDLAQRNVDCAE